MDVNLGQCDNTGGEPVGGGLGLGHLATTGAPPAAAAVPALPPAGISLVPVKLDLNLICDGGGGDSDSDEEEDEEDGVGGAFGGGRGGPAGLEVKCARHVAPPPPLSRGGGFAVIEDPGKMGVDVMRRVRASFAAAAAAAAAPPCVFAAESCTCNSVVRFAAAVECTVLDSAGES